MPVQFREPPTARFDAPPPIVRAVREGARAAARLADTARDLLLPDHARLDDRLRAAVSERLRTALGGIEREIRLNAAHRLSDVGASVAAERLLAEADTVLPRLRRRGLVADTELMAELVGTTRLAMLAQALPHAADDDHAWPSFLVRLTDCSDPDVARTARQLLVASSRDELSTLPAPLHARMCWWTAATLRAELGDEPRADLALADAATIVGGADAGPSVEAASVELAEAIAARPDELPDLLVQSLDDRRPALFTALLATASAIGFADVRAIVTDPHGARLWMLLRARGLERVTVARIGVALAAGDPSRDLGRFADEIDEVAAVSPEAAAASFASLSLPVEYRHALDRVRGRG